MTRDTPSLPRALHRLREALALDQPPIADADLLRQFRESRDPAAFESLVRRHGPGVMSACRKVLSDDADVEDAFQAAFLILLRDGRSIRKGASVGSWLYGVAHRVALKARAARRRRTHVESRAPARESTTHDLSWPEACAILHEELDRLPDKYRLPVMLCYLEGLARDEAARRLGVSLNAVRNRLERGRARLRDRLARRGIALSAGLLATVTGSAAALVPTSLVRATSSAVLRPSARVATLAATVLGAGTIKIAMGLTLVAALLIGAGLRAGPTPKVSPSKEMPAKDAAKKVAPKADDDTPETLDVKGRVLDPNGKPVKGAKLWLVLEPTAVRRTAPGPSVVATTDADGAFAFTEKGDGRRRHWANGAQLVTTADGFGAAWAAAKMAKDKPLELKLVQDEPINGRILTLEGKPIAGVRIRVLEVSVPAGPDLSNLLAELKANARPIHEIHVKYFDYQRRLFETGGVLPGQPEATVTDRDGRFRLTGLGGERLVQLRIDGPTVATVEHSVLTRAMPSMTVLEDPGDRRYGQQTYYGSTFDFAAEPTQPFEGVVTDRETSKPLAGVTVRAALQWYEVKAVTDASGKYRLTGLPPGPHEMIAIPAPDQPYHRMAATGGEKASQKTAALDFALTRGHWVTGKLINLRTNKPEADAPIWYFPLADEPAYLSVPGSHAWSREPTTYTNSDGTFRVVAFSCRGAIVANGWSGDYITAEQRPLQGDAESLDRGTNNAGTLSTSPAAYLGSYHAAAIVNVDSKKPKDCTITLDPGMTASVKLLDPDGKPLMGAGAGGLASWSLWEKDLAAEVKVRQYNPDRPRALLFLHQEKGLGKLLEPKKGDAGPWEVTLEPVGTATGRLVDTDSKPLANAVLQIHYRLPGHDAWTPSFVHQEARTDEKGIFRLSNLVGGVLYSLRYSTERGGARSRHYEHVRLKAGETKDLGDVKPRGE